MFAAIRKMLRGEAVVTALHGAVVRPGDTVIVSTNDLHSVDVLSEAIREKLPEGASLFLMVGDRVGASNLSRLLEQHLHQLGNERACRCDCDPSERATGPDAEPSESREVIDQAAITFEVTWSPVLFDEFLPHSRRLT